MHLHLSTDPTLTLDSVAAVLKDQSINQVRPCLKVPILVQYRKETQNKSEDQLKVTLSEWWLASSPFAAWDLLAADVENTSDMETVRSRLPKTGVCVWVHVGRGVGVGNVCVFTHT